MHLPHMAIPFMLVTHIIEVGGLEMVRDMQIPVQATDFGLHQQAQRQQLHTDCEIGQIFILNL